MPVVCVGGSALERKIAHSSPVRAVSCAKESDGLKMQVSRSSREYGIRFLLRVIFYVMLAFQGLLTWHASARAQSTLPTTLYPVGMRMEEFVEPGEGHRPLDYMLIYPAAPDRAATPFKIFLYSNLHLYKDAPVVADQLRRPLVVFSHGAGGNGSGYAWFGEYLAAHGYIVAMVYHYRANTYDSSALYVRNRLWQRPRDISLDITHLLQDKFWGPHIDPHQIGVAGHSQGGFTALWIGGARVNPLLFLNYQRGWKNNGMVPAYLRDQMRIDAGPALDVRDARVKAAFAMAPGDIQGFGMDAAGLRQMDIPVYIIVGAGDTTTPPQDNAAFAAQFIPHAQLDILPGPVNHEIFDNECDQLGRDNYPEACVDAPGVDRAKLHQYIGSVALKFFDTNLGVRRESSK
jgi:predicted dienelactone hydrolase